MEKSPFTLSLLGALLTLTAPAALPDFGGVWDLEGSLAPRYACQTPLTATGWSPSYTNSTIGVQSGPVLSVPALAPGQRLGFTHTASPNGGPGATRVNQWTVVMDVRFSTIANYVGLLQTHPGNGDDVDVWINGNGSLTFGSAVSPPGTFVANTWYRVALTAENNGAGAALVLRAYINGVPTASTAASPFNGRHSLASPVFLFTDDTGDTRPLLLGAAGFWPSPLTAAEIASLGGPSANGLTGSWNTSPCPPGSSILAGSRYAWSANTGWINGNWNPAGPNGGSGAVLTPWLCYGWIWSGNLGWIHLGDGHPASGVRYSQTGGEYGVNHDGAGALYASAWCPNAGWIYFGKSPAARPTDRWRQDPRVDLRAGNLYGYAWSGNTGWLQLGAAAGSSRLVTQFSGCGDDTDNDRLPDSWERERLSIAGLPQNMATLGRYSDTDGDGSSDVSEFAADTNPFNDDDRLAILSFDKTGASVTCTWRSKASRIYHLEISPDLSLWDEMTEPVAGTGGILTDGGPVALPKNFFRVRAWSPFCPP